MNAAADMVHSTTTRFLRSRYPSAKHAAVDLDATLATAEGWWRGKPMGRRHFANLVRRGGRAAVEFIFGPVVDESRDLMAELAAVQTALAAIQEKLRDDAA